MKKVVVLLSTAALAAGLFGCKGETETPATPAAQPAAPAAQPAQAPAPQAAGQSGTVVETMDAGGYTYVQVDTGAEKIWAAAPQFKVTVGDAVVVPAGMPMTNFESKTLGKTFETVLFVDSIMTAGAEVAAGEQPLPADHPSTMVSAAPAADVDLSGISKADKSIAELFAGKAELSGKQVSVRGKVVKYNEQIMGKNWIHLQDGTGEAGNNDLTITTASAAKVGDTVLVSGAVVLDKDFGYGYKYDLIIEDAKVTVE